MLNRHLKHSLNYIYKVRNIYEDKQVLHHFKKNTMTLSLGGSLNTHVLL